MTTIRSLILDLGNVLLFHDNDRLYRELAAASGRTAAEIPVLLAHAGGPNWLNITDCAPADVYRAVAQATGFPGSFDEFAAIWNGIFWPHEEIVPLLEALRGRVRLTVLSNTNALHMAHIRGTLPVLELFDDVLTSYEIGAAKPDAAIYEHALRVASVRPHEAAFFDDVQTNVDAADALGIHGFLFTDAAAFRRDVTLLGLGGALP